MSTLQSVLLVDDDKITNFINQRLIQKLSIAKTVTVVNNGKEAVDFFRQSADALPDLILLDINMPVMDGFEFVEHFKKMNIDKKIVIVMLTTSSNEKDIDKISKSPEIAGYINKPLTDQKLTDSIKSYFSSSVQ